MKQEQTTERDGEFSGNSSEGLDDGMNVFDSFKQLLSFSYRPAFTRLVGHFVAVQLKRLCDIFL